MTTRERALKALLGWLRQRPDGHTEAGDSVAGQLEALLGPEPYICECCQQLVPSSISNQPLLEASRTLVASLEWEERRSGTTYHGYEAVRTALASLPQGSPVITSAKNHLVCRHCGSLEVEYLVWLRVNDSRFAGGNESISADDYWCPDCETHDRLVRSADYCEDNGHSAQPCMRCGAA